MLSIIKNKIMFNIRSLIIIVILSMLVGCSEQVDYTSPAQSQIDEYTALLKKCKQDKEKTESPNNIPPSPEKDSKPQIVASEKIIKQPAATSKEAIQKSTATAEKDLQQQMVTSEKALEPHTASPEKAIEQQNAEGDGSQPNTPPSNIVENPQQVIGFGITPDDIVLGNRDSKVVVTEYFSPTCPHCAYFKKEVLPEIQKKYIDTNKIAYVIREFISNKQDLDASILARCSNNKDSFLKFTNVLLEQQNNWAFNKKYREVLTNIGQIGGVSAESYANCLNNERLIEVLINNTKVAAKSPKFIGTPAFFINGVQFTNPYTVAALSKSIEDALNNTQLSK